MTVTAPSSAVPIVDGQLYVLGGTVEPKGRIHWIAKDATGDAPLNAFVIVDGNRGLVVDTSLPIVSDAIVDQLKGLGLEELNILMTRPVEFDSMGNCEVLIKNFNVARVYSELTFPPEYWVAFRDEEPLPPFEPLVYKKGTDMQFGGRRLSLIDARLKLLATVWVYDHATKTLFTSDSFAHVYAAQPGVQIVTAETDTTTEEQVMAHMLTKFDWMAGAFTGPMRRFCNEVFDTFDVENIAPTIGCVLQGRELVERHRQLMDDTLRKLAEMENIA
jgi:flavorubredoxin